MNETPANALREKVAGAPRLPGCSLFYDLRGRIIYIGKSKLLRNRVRQYFHEAAAKDDRTRDLVREIRNVAYRVTPTELEALVLEYCLIKRHRPWFNAQHMRDTIHPYLRIDEAEAYPTISIADRPYDGAGYYGMFADDYAAQDAIELLSRVWQTPRCERASFARVERPCVFYDMRQCAAPCRAMCGQAEYRAAIADIVRLLTGKKPEAMARLERDMREQAARMAFEQAAETKALMERLDCIRRKCARSLRVDEKTHAVVLMRAYGEAASSAFGIRAGKVIAHAVLADGADGAALEAFIGRVCTPGDALPDAEWLPGCLMEIYAHKACIVFVPRSADKTIADRVRAGYARFCERTAKDLPPAR